MKDLSKDRIVIIATHIVPDIENIAKEILILKKRNFSQFFYLVRLIN